MRMKLLICKLVLLQFPPEFETGDGCGIDMKLSNKVYNKLKQHSEQVDKRSQRLHEKKEHSTAVSTDFHLYTAHAGSTLMVIGWLLRLYFQR